jgi:hypothetical protein
MDYNSFHVVRCTDFDTPWEATFGLQANWSEDGPQDIEYALRYLKLIDGEMRTLWQAKGDDVPESLRRAVEHHRPTREFLFGIVQKAWTAEWPPENGDHEYRCKMEAALRY